MQAEKQAERALNRNRIQIAFLSLPGPRREKMCLRLLLLRLWRIKPPLRVWALVSIHPPFPPSLALFPSSFCSYFSSFFLPLFLSLNPLSLSLSSLVCAFFLFPSLTLPPSLSPALLCSVSLLSLPLFPPSWNPLVRCLCCFLGGLGCQHFYLSQGGYFCSDLRISLVIMLQLSKCLSCIASVLTHLIHIDTTSNICWES